MPFFNLFSIRSLIFSNIRIGDLQSSMSTESQIVYRFASQQKSNTLFFIKFVKNMCIFLFLYFYDNTDKTKYKS